mgnify:CR=1 FL=1
MKQIIQNLKNGETILEDLPVPNVQDGCVLIKSHCSLVSLGTEKMLVNFGKANFFQKARQQPEKVKEVLNKIKSDGLKPTLDVVFRKLDQPLPLGYCNAGEVIGIGKGVSKFKIGDRVASNGNHAEVVNVPENLVALIPNDVSFEHASFTVIGAIALQGIRLAKLNYGETVVVIGLGLIGLITVQLLKSSGCEVIGFDFDDNKVELAKSYDVEAYNSSQIDSVSTVMKMTNNIGCDSVIITASSKSNLIISQAAQMSRKRGRIILVGVIGLDINRSDMYEKELTFQVSCSYGPGRYDNNYEQKGFDYPISYVRWTENRNFCAILKSIQNGNLKLDKLITKRINLEDFKDVYEDMTDNQIASLLKYDTHKNLLSNTISITDKKINESHGVIAVIGAGNFSSSVILPILKKINANTKYIASARGLSGTTLCKKYNIPKSTSDVNVILNDSSVNAVIITTQHHDHYNQVINAIKNNKHVFVEKPLAISREQVDSISDEYKRSNVSITVGYNRRFSPLINIAKKTIGNSPQINVIATMNAGFIDSNHWVQDLELGGGRIIGEACHYIDLISYLTGCNVKSVVMNSQGLVQKKQTDNASILLKYENGSQGIINYFSDGHKSYSKERIEIFFHGKNIVIDNFKKINFYGFKSRDKKITQDKGHFMQFKKWNDMIVNGGEPLITFDSIINTSKASFACLESLEKKSWIDV